MRWIIIFLILITKLFGQKKLEVPADFLSMLTKEQREIPEKIKFDGFYDNITLKSQGNKKASKKAYFATNPLFFFTNGLSLLHLGKAIDSVSYLEYLTKYYFLEGGERNWGSYDIRNDTVSVILLRLFNKNNAQKYKYAICYYQGIIKNKDTIVNWRLIEPYPVVNEKYNNLTMEKISSTLIFKPFHSEIMDPNKVWIKVYKNEGRKNK